MFPAETKFFDMSAEYLIISGSLREASMSRVMAEALKKNYESLGVSCRLIDLREFTLPLCDAGEAYGHAHLPTLNGEISGARVIVIATPIYNYDASAAVKNLMELTGDSWEDKTVGFLCAAGGSSSYMSIMSLANSLMLDFRCLIIPRFVYAHGKDFVDREPTPALAERINELAAASLKIKNAA